MRWSCNPVMFAAFKTVIRRRYERSQYNKKAVIRYIIAYLRKYKFSSWQVLEVNEIIKTLK